MDTPRFQRVFELFDRCRTAAPGERRDILDAGCPDAQMRREVLELLDEHERPSEFLEEGRLGLLEIAVDPHSLLDDELVMDMMRAL